MNSVLPNDKMEKPIKPLTSFNHVYVNPYLNFVRDYQLLMRGGFLSGAEVTWQAYKIWKEMSPEEKKPYEESVRLVQEVLDDIQCVADSLLLVVSMSTGRLAWFSSEKGRKCVLAALSVAGGGLMCAHIFPNTFFLYKYKEFVQSYRLGVGVRVPQNVQNLVEQVMVDLNMSPQERKLIAPFTVFGFDIFHAGSTASKYGAIIGIPESFSYMTKKDVTKQPILVKNEPLDWAEKSSVELVDSLVLSENAKKFAIGREIVSSQTIEPYLNAAFPVTVIFFIYSFTHTLNKRMDLFARPLSMRGLLYSITGLFGFGVWSFLTDFSSIQYEKEADEKMCSLGEDYIHGGIEFYSHILQRNKSLRHLMGKDGEKLYTVSGNENFFIRQKRLPISHRIKYLESKQTGVLGA